MKLSLNYKALVLAAASSCSALALVIPGRELFRPAPASAGAVEALVIPPAGTPAHEGYELFLHNCAHCHGSDARGDEGPDLHGVTKSDTRITSMIQNGIKGEMPKFNGKLKDNDVKNLIAFIRTLKD